MAYFVIEDFRIGLESSRLPEATPPGALVLCQNAYINRGAEIEKAKGFVAAFSVLPAGTFGLGALGDALYVFGSGADPGVPAGITYQQLAHESAEAMTEVLNTDNFGGETFVTAQFANGDRRAFSDAVIVAGFLTGSGTVFEDLVLSPALLTYRNKLYLSSTTNLLFSKSGAADIFDELQTGCGLIDQSVYVSGEADINGLASYQNYLAALSVENISIWATDPDPAAYELIQVLPNIGTRAPRSIKSYGSADVFFLSDNGIRSIRAANNTLSAGVIDVGTPIDDLVVAQMTAVGDDTVRKAAGVIEPRDGRYMLPIGEEIYCFTGFLAKKIAAWSTLNPGFTVTDWARIGKKLYARAGQQIYLLGGEDNDEYTDQPVTIILPFLDARTLVTGKYWTGIDFVGEGVWDVYINTDPNDDTAWTETATVTETTLDKMDSGMEGYGPVLALKFVHQGDGPAKISKIIVHYKKDSNP